MPKTETQIRSLLQSAIDRTNADFVERRSTIHMLFAALVGNTHVWMFGPPGEGKSQLARHVVSFIEGAEFFDLLMFRDRRNEEVNGPLKLSELPNDRYERKVDGYLPSAHYAMVDEGGRSSSIIRDSMLRLMNERTYRNGDQIHRAPLRAMFSGSNSLLTDEESAAFVDRFHGTVYVPRVSEEGLRTLLTRQETDPRRKAVYAPSPLLTLDDMDAATEHAKRIPYADGVLDDEFMGAVYLLHKAGIRPSTRRWMVIQNALRPIAWLMGDDEVTGKHCEWIKHFVWRTEDERRLAERLLSDAFNPSLAEAIREHDLATATYQGVPQDCHDMSAFKAANIAMRKHVRAIEALNSNDPQVADVLKRVQQMAKELVMRSRAAMGVS